MGNAEEGQSRRRCTTADGNEGYQVQDEAIVKQKGEEM